MIRVDVDSVSQVFGNKEYSIVETKGTNDVIDVLGYFLCE